MNGPISDRARPMTSQLALRVAVIGVVAFALFAVIFFRLWYLQVLSGDQYLRQSQNNRLRNVRVQAPRGRIVDRHGDPLVENRRATIVQISPRSLPDAERVDAALWGQQVGARLRIARRSKVHGPPVPIPPIATPELAGRLRRLGRVVGMKADDIQRLIVQQLAQLPYAPVKVRTAVPASVRSYIRERQEHFPGVEVREVWVRRYAYKTVGAQLVGTVSEVSPAELEQEHFRGVTQGTLVGQEGLEYYYDRSLRGRDGATRYLVDAFGNNKGKTRERKEVPGHQLRLSIDLALQRAGQAAIGRAGKWSKPGAFVALDPRNGQVLAMGSAPSFNPTVLTRPISQAKYDALFGPTAGSPRVNRAIAGLYPTGSTFKVITAMAALTKGVITPDTIIYDGGCVYFGRTACNARGASYGPVNLRRALQVSSDVFFYTMGMRTDVPGHPIQTWARRFGLDNPTGIDLPGELGGIIPDPAWRAAIGKQEERCEKRRRVQSCGISDKRPWSLGDNVNLAIGQGDVLATPLQMAVLYSSIANGGRVVRPHLGLQIENETGEMVRKINPPPARRIKLDPRFRQAILDGLHLAASAPGGTSAFVFTGWPQDKFPVYGKTGTAERPGHGDQSWYVCYVASRTKPIVVAVTIEGGGFGAVAAAPAARQILSQWFLGKRGKFFGPDTAAE
jgi:penicillin-binding protein 2